MPWVGFEPTIPVFEPVKTARQLWSAGTLILQANWGSLLLDRRERNQGEAICVSCLEIKWKWTVADVKTFSSCIRSLSHSNASSFFLTDEDCEAWQTQIISITDQVFRSNRERIFPGYSSIDRLYNEVKLWKPHTVKAENSVHSRDLECVHDKNLAS
jgi:hypothetical protein